MTTPSHDRHHKNAPQSVTGCLNRAAELLWEVDAMLKLGISTSAETAANEIALTQLLVAAANANLRAAEVEMAAHDWREQL